jgi:hypothetical protein
VGRSGQLLLLCNKRQTDVYPFAKSRRRRYPILTYLNLIRKIETAFMLEGEVVKQAAEALFLRFLISLSFGMFGVLWTQRALHRWAYSRKCTPKKPHASMASAMRAQRIVIANGLGGTCLVRSLTLWTMLLRRGVRTDLRVGFRKRDDSVEGHAWLEYDGVPINESPSVVATYSVSDSPGPFDPGAMAPSETSGPG